MDNNTIENGVSNLILPYGDGLVQEGILRTALRHRWIILSTAILFLVAGFIYILKATPIYTSSARVYVEQSGPKIITEYKGVMTQSKNYLYTQGELIKSTPVVANLVDGAQTKRLKTFANVDNLVAYIKNNLGVSIGKKDDIIAVSFDSAYPEEAAQIVNAVVDSYISYHSTRKQSTASKVLNILQKEKIKRDKELSDKFAEILEFTRENRVVSFDNKGGNIVFEKLSKLSGALTQAQLATINAKADFEGVKGMMDEPAKIKQFAAASASAGVHVFVNDRETQLRSELRKAEMELENARYYCTEDHPSIQAIHTKIGLIKQELNEQGKEFAEAYIDVMQLRWMTAKEREDKLQASFDEQYRAARDLGVKATEYLVLQSQLNRAERICEILDDRIKELNVTEDVGALNISILEVARPAGSPSKPQKARVMLMALAFGLMLGGGLAFLCDWLDYRLRSSEEISAILGVPVFGVVPRISVEPTIVTHGQKAWLKLKPIVAEVRRILCSEVLSRIRKGKTKAEKETIMARAAAHRLIRASMFGDVRGSKAKTTVVRPPTPSDAKATSEKQSFVEFGRNAYLKPKSLAAEAYRTIRTAVFFGIPKDEAKTILITSPASGDGKTTLVSNLAITMAQAGQRTLILDGDFRKPRQHEIFEIDGETGLSNVLAGTITLDEAIQPGLVEGLDILSCGQEVPNPSEILNSDAFAGTLQDLSERYDRIIIDSPPVGLVTDSQILAATCDVTLLVLQAEKSTRKHSQQACDGLLSVGAHIFGAVVNDVSRKCDRYGYYSGYGYYGHYGYYGKGKKKKEYEQNVCA